MRTFWFVAVWIYNLLLLVPAKWDDLPLPALYKCSLDEAILDVPWFLCNYPADDEVVGFTQNGGWQKINNVLVLLYRYSKWFRGAFGTWISCFQEISDRLKVSCSFLRRGSL